jgi:hypothetical protein
MIPSNLTRQTVTLTRRVTTGAGNVDTVIATGIPARIETRLKVTQTQQGTLSQIITTAYLQPCDARTGDRVTFTNGTVLEIRSAATVYGANGTTAALVKVTAW